MAAGRCWRSPRFVCLALYFYLCFTGSNYQKRKKRQSQVFYTSNLLFTPRIASYIYQTRNVSAAKTNGSESYSLRVLLGCRLALNASISLLLIQLANDVEVQPGQAQRANGLRICQWNVQRLTDSKLEEIRSLVARPGNEHDRLDILILSETFCTQKVPDSFYNTVGYQRQRKNRMGKSGGGILVYVNNSLQAKRREDLEADELEILWLEVCPYKSSRSLFIGGVYTPPSCRVADDIENVHLLNKEIILLGDINIDFLCTMKLQKHPFIKTLQDLNMSQLVLEITRPLSKSCLDHTWSSHPKRLLNVRLLSTGMSDHLPAIVTRKYKGVQQNKSEHTTITYRHIKNS